jgi:hypothetical protein
MRQSRKEEIQQPLGGYYEGGSVMRTETYCPGEKWNKVMLVVAALLVFASIRLPYWQIHIVAPQYPKGLNVIVYVTGAGGDVREVDGLNHYIGMRPLGEAAPFERKISLFPA